MKFSPVLLHHFKLLLLITAIFLITAYFLIPYISPGLTYISLLVTVLYFFFITGLLFVLFYKGLSKEPRKGIIYTYAAVSLKLLANILFIIVFYLITKNLTIQFLISFFALYLTFTLYLLLAFIKEFKKKQE